MAANFGPFLGSKMANFWHFGLFKGGWSWSDAGQDRPTSGQAQVKVGT